MHTDKRSNVIFWSVTLLFAAPMALAGIAELIGLQAGVAILEQLGYPRYLLIFLGVAKLLGVAALLAGAYPRLKEWAYAGFTFTLLGACYSHLASGQILNALNPIAIGIVGAASYLVWRRQPGRAGGDVAAQGRRDQTAASERTEAI
jgi:uncharacterized membrane protein YphA (DoxX/SURF4 family)